MSEQNSENDIKGACPQQSNSKVIARDLKKLEDACTTANTAAATKSTASKRLDDEINESETKTLYVSNLHPRIAEAHLQKLFGKFGTVERIHFVRKPNLRNVRKPFTFAFVKYASNISAKTAIENIHDRLLLGEKLVVRFANSEQYANDAFGSKRAGSSEASDTRSTKKQKFDVQKKIEAVKKALAHKQGL